MESTVAPDPDEGLELRPEVVEALARALDTPRDALLTPDEAWERFNLPLKQDDREM